MEFRFISALVFSLFLIGCSSSEQEQAQAAPPAQPIDVANVISAPIVDWQQFTSRLETTHSVELRPRVSGVVESVDFVEGALVQKGDLLFTLDQRPFRADASRLAAQKEAAEVAYNQAEKEAKRAQNLRKKGLIADEVADAKVFAAQERKANLAAVKASYQTAQLNLDYTEIRSPLTGRVSSAFVQPGNTVNANSSVLTHLVATENAYAYFDIPERTWNKLFTQVTDQSGLAVYLQLTGDQDYRYQGELDFIDNQINPNTGTLRVRAKFRNSNSQLRPGAFARVRIAPQEVTDSILVPETAVGTDLNIRFVMTVDDNNVLQFRLVTLGSRIGPLRVITSGLEAGDRVAVNGPARVGPGMTIQPREVEIDTSSLELNPAVTRVGLSSDSAVALAQ